MSEPGKKAPELFETILMILEVQIVTLAVIVAPSSAESSKRRELANQLRAKLEKFIADKEWPR